MRGLRVLLVWAVFVLPLLGRAAIIDPGLFPLGNHPDGRRAPPSYGLRLDGLSGNPDQEFTFDFEAPGAGMFMEFGSDGRLRIFGRAFGGRDVGDRHEDPQLWEIEFVYARLRIDGDRLVSDPAAAPGQGSLTPTATLGGFTAGVPIGLTDFRGTHDASFVIEESHRGLAGFSGFGWLNHEVAGLDRHVASSDWLFRVVPEPGSIGLLALGLVLLVAARRGFPGSRARPDRTARG
jgi:hypothetical protein